MAVGGGGAGSDSEVPPILPRLRKSCRHFARDAAIEISYSLRRERPIAAGWDCQDFLLAPMAGGEGGGMAFRNLAAILPRDIFVKISSRLSSPLFFPSYLD